ncbi:MAG: hypothetical protein ABF265_10490 [Polaribacter sp.]
MRKIKTTLLLIFITTLSLAQSGRGLGHEDDVSWYDTIKTILFLGAIYYVIILPYNTYHEKKKEKEREKKEAEEKIKQEAKDMQREIQSNYKLYLNKEEQELLEKAKAELKKLRKR